MTGPVARFIWLQPLRQAKRPVGALHAAIVTSGAAALVACSTVAKLPPAPVKPLPISQSVPTTPYQIQVGDVLDVRLLLNPELNEEVLVRPDGHISTTVVADEVAAGRTVPELTSALRKDYSHDLRNPRITVLVKSFSPTRIYVGGEVVNPGEFITVGPTLTLSQAIARAGGSKLSSDDSSIFVIRRGADDKPEYLSVSYGSVMHATDPNADVRLAPYDAVYVPKSGIAEVYKWYNQYIGQFANPSFGFSYLLNPAAAAGGTVITPAGR